MQDTKRILRLVESALLMAVAAVLSFVKLLDLPYGGAVTACSTLPLIVIAYRHGTRWGVFAGAAYGLLQLVLGMSVLSYCPSALSAAAVIVLDYLLAFAAMGLGGVWRRGRTQSRALIRGALMTGGVRYVCHVISGCTVWAGLSIPTDAALFYSLAYNATYMLPETAVTALGAWYLSQALDLRGERPTRAESVRHSGKTALAAKAAVALTAIVDVVLICAHLQDAESGEFRFSGLAAVPWVTVGIVTTVGIAAVAAGWLSRRKK